MSLSEDDLTQLVKIRRTVLQMLLDRGYSVDGSEINMTRQELLQKFGDKLKREDLTIHKVKAGDSSNQIYVFFPSDAKISTQEVRNIVRRLETDNVSRAILVAQQSVTHYAKKCIDEISKKFQIEVFEEAELVVNVTEHSLVPKHEALTDDVKKKVLDHYRVKETQLPRILVNDPVARYYGLKRGQIVKIYRKSETAGNYATYRCVG